MNEKKLQRLEEKIREAVPEKSKHVAVNSNGHTTCLHCGTGDFHLEKMPPCKCRPLTLQDVLIAVANKDEMVAILETGEIEYKGKEVGFFNLTKDYHSQSDEFYEFLYSLLIDD